MSTPTITNQVPVLLPEYAQPKPDTEVSWQPSKYLGQPTPPPVDEGQVKDLEMAAQRQLMDGKALKKTRPRRTVDYGGGMGRWALVSWVGYRSVYYFLNKVKHFFCLFFVYSCVR